MKGAWLRSAVPCRRRAAAMVRSCRSAAGVSRRQERERRLELVKELEEGSRGSPYFRPRRSGCDGDMARSDLGGASRDGGEAGGTPPSSRVAPPLPSMASDRRPYARPRAAPPQFSAPRSPPRRATQQRELGQTTRRRLPAPISGLLAAPGRRIWSQFCRS